MLRRLTLASIAALLLASFYPRSAHAHEQTVAISVGRDGFDHMANYTVEVEAGHEVTIIFTYADGDLEADNPHQLRVSGLGLDLPAVTVSRDHPTATITFTPTETGALSILCLIPCIGMERLVSGQIKVVALRPAGASVSLALEITPREDGSALARAILHDARGDPIGNVPIVFSLHTSVGGDLEIGAPATAGNGSAVVLIPAVSGQVLDLTASFEGGNGFAFTQTSAEIMMPGAPQTFPVGALSSPSAPPVLVFILLTVLGSIWATYGTVAYQIFRIRRN